MNTSPYAGKNPDEWVKITTDLVKKHPLSSDRLVTLCKTSWNEIFSSTIGGIIKIGAEVNLSPQMIGNFLHILIAHHLSADEPKLWREEIGKGDKDIVYIPDDFFSFEIKTSSSANDIYGNRSYAQPQAENAQKGKAGYYLSINFTKTVKGTNQEITKIKFGWLDHSDWIAQVSPTGQQCRLTQDAKSKKLLTLFSK